MNNKGHHRLADSQFNRASRMKMPGYVSSLAKTWLIISLLSFPFGMPLLITGNNAYASTQSSNERTNDPSADEPLVIYRMGTGHSNPQPTRPREAREYRTVPQQHDTSDSPSRNQQPPKATAAETKPQETPQSRNTIDTPPIAAGNMNDSSDELNKTARDTNSVSPLVTNMFYDTPLRQALADISAQTGVIIVPDISVQGIVTCELKDVPLERALNIVLSCGNFVSRQMDGYILVGTSDIQSPSFSKLCITERLKMNYLKAEEAIKMLSEPMRKLTTANATNNIVSVTAPEDLVTKIIADLKRFDQPSKHVMLDARIVAIGNGDLLNLGVQWDWPRIAAGAFSDSDHHGGGASERVPWPWGIQIGYTPGQEFTNSLLMTLNLLSQNDEATVIASPQVLAKDGQEAEIKVVTQEYFKITQESYAYTRFELENIETGTILTIIPQIGENNEITLHIAAEVSDVIARGEDNLPVVTRRTTKNTVCIKDGGTAAIAGLIDTRKRFQKSRTPGLSHIPLLGFLFDNANQTESSKQVAVFITARLMREPELVTKESLVRRPPTKPAEKDFKAALQQALSKLKREYY